MRAASEITIVLSTYERPEVLELLFRALADQTTKPEEIIVADDGSGPAVAAVVDRWRRRLHVKHVWQPDSGFRKTRVLNVAAREAKGDYLLFLDADCLPRRTLLEAVEKATVPGWFVGSKRIDLSPGFSAAVIEQELPIWRWSFITWLRKGRGEIPRPGLFIPLRDRDRPWRPGPQDFVPTANAYGFCLGVHRSDFERVNGYDMRFIGRANEDSDLVLRLGRAGARCGWPGPGATMFHLWHARPPDRPNEGLYFETRDSDRVEAVEGMRELARRPEDQSTEEW